MVKTLFETPKLEIQVTRFEFIHSVGYHRGDLTALQPPRFNLAWFWLLHLGGEFTDKRTLSLILPFK